MEMPGRGLWQQSDGTDTFIPLEIHQRIRFKSTSGKIYNAQVTNVHDDIGFEAGFVTKRGNFETWLIKWEMVLGHIKSGQPHADDEDDWCEFFDSGPDEWDAPVATREQRGYEPGVEYARPPRMLTRAEIKAREKTPATASEETDNTPERTSGSVDQGRLGSNNTGTPGICSMGGIGRPHNTVDNSAEAEIAEPALLPTVSSESTRATTRAARTARRSASTTGSWRRTTRTAPTALC